MITIKHGNKTMFIKQLKRLSNLNPHSKTGPYVKTFNLKASVNNDLLVWTFRPTLLPFSCRFLIRKSTDIYCTETTKVSKGFQHSILSNFRQTKDPICLTNFLGFLQINNSLPSLNWEWRHLWMSGMINLLFKCDAISKN